MTAEPILDRMFQPNSVAIVGASDDGSRISGRPLRYLLEAGYRGRIYPVNPRRDIVQGVRCFPTIRALPETPDVALLALAGSLVEEALAECAACGIRAVMLMSAGFAETGADGQAAQERLRAFAHAHGIRVLGPNCLGAFNAAHRFFGSFATSLDRGFPEGGPIAVVSQSGAYGQHIAYLARMRGLGVGYLITTGNEMDLDLAECLDWLVRRPEVRVVMAYAEGIRNGGRLLAALATARAHATSVVFLKVGSSEVGAQAASSHTAALAGSDAVFDAVLRQHGAWRARSTEQQLDIAGACTRGTLPAGDRLCIVTVSGGAGVQIADEAAAQGLVVPPTPEPLRSQLAALLPFAAVGNPIDVTGQVVNDPPLLSRNLALLCAAPYFDSLIIYLTTVPLDRSTGVRVRQAIADGLGTRHDMPVALCMVADPEVVAGFEADGFLVFEDAVRAVAALGALAGLARARRAASAMRPAAVAAEPRMALPATGLSEPEAKRLLRDWGVPTLPECLAATAAAAADFAARQGGKVAMKIASPDIAHKTEIGGVLLGVAAPDAAAGFDTLMSRARQAAPAARIEGVLVAPMAPAGVELIAGAVSDPVFGPLVMVGLGGTLVEALGDVAFRAAPIDEAEALRMIGETRAPVLLAGVRGAKRADTAALAACLCALSRLAAANAATLGSLEINPLLVLPEGAGVLALDAACTPPHEGPTA